MPRSIDNKRVQNTRPISVTPAHKLAPANRAFDLEKVKKRQKAIGLNNTQLAKKAGISRGTVINLLKTGRGRTDTIDLLLRALDTVAEELQRTPTLEEAEAEYGLVPPNNYEIVAVDNPMLFAANGVAFQIVKLRSLINEERCARGKFYSLLHAPPATSSKLREQLKRHARVCSRLANEPRIAKHYDIRPLANDTAWWIIDEWLEGEALADAINAEHEFSNKEIKQLGTEILLALNSLHENEIIVRELAPERIIVGNPQRPCVLTDFELAKFAQGELSVSGDWKLFNPYRAPEVQGTEAFKQSDLFSWATIMTELLTGTTDAGKKEIKAVVKTTAIVELITNCRKSVYYNRPTTVSKVIEIWANWKA